MPIATGRISSGCRYVATSRVKGFSLVELMIAMVLGLVVIAGAGSVFLASSRTYQTNQALSDVQTNSRVAFELMARDIRQAGLNGCSNNGRVSNVLNNGPNGPSYNPTKDWFAAFSNAVQGYDGAAPDPAVAIGTGQNERVAGTDSIQLKGVEGSGLSVSNTPSGFSANFKLSEVTTDLQTGDIIIVCDFDHATIVQVSVAHGTNVTLNHTTGNKTSPGNCSNGLGYPTVCTTTGNGYKFDRNSQVAKLTAVDWYIGNNPVNGRSLYRVSLVNKSGVPTPTSQEMVRNVTGMQISYHESGSASFKDAKYVSNWGAVDAVRVHLTLESTDKRAGTDTKALSRNFWSTTTIRNRVQ
ncbi:prepilin-type N-terminal cleavage/methylation domain-containing protein [Oleiagrimonas sp. MCCC 1A03011]|uniref:prepilin-type N-terminal cleavage/methylation domain-containing protein n=1 Tax=Oleiagrimonas sp. MCCC 1A03011 TaxID=1926883 RepID=UPI000DC476C8|nr:prepilin-type N-terminal cleavage/methylation domain-containing protein [Oleiagrimonas sp. MCCC 1A03011]RAP56448.1 prepilin-type N-terminal cleavage/methylation domain-containing protein [Oleiagrimonas sp. MCCC 1A03011]